MHCPDCDRPTVPFSVPPELRAYTPDVAEGGSGSAGDAAPQAAAICPRCYRTYALGGDEAVDAPDAGAADFDAVDQSFPSGEAGVALALALGKLDSLALNRAAVSELLEHAEASGADVFLALDRLDREGAHVDLDRRVAQIENLF